MDRRSSDLSTIFSIAKPYVTNFLLSKHIVGALKL